jgi:hypothetical protein
MVWIELIWLRMGTVEGCCEHGNEPLGSIKCREILEWLHSWRLLKKDSAPLVRVDTVSLKGVGLATGYGLTAEGSEFESR